MIYEPWDILLVPFPFTDKVERKRRPTVVLSTRDYNETGFVIVAMITTARRLDWPSDTPITDLAQAGLPRASVVRLSLSTLDTFLVQGKLGCLAGVDREHVLAAMQATLVSSPA